MVVPRVGGASREESIHEGNSGVAPVGTVAAPVEGAASGSTSTRNPDRSSDPSALAKLAHRSSESPAAR